MSPERLADLEELVLKCDSPRSRVYIEEALACYESGAYRACIVTTWIALVFDIHEKLQQLALGGDKAAQLVLDAFSKARQEENFQTALRLERELLDDCKSKFELITALEYQDLKRLLDDRHRCAHPSMNTDDDPYKPSPELARAHLRNAVSYVLQHPPTQGKTAFEKVMRDIQSSLFPVDAIRAATSLRAGPIGRPRAALVRNIVIVLMKSLLLGDLNEQDRLRHSAALGGLYKLHRESTDGVIQEKLSATIRQVGDQDLFKAVLMLDAVPECGAHLEEDVLDRLRTFVSGMPRPFFASYIIAALRVDLLRDQTISRINAATVEELVTSGLAQDPPSEFLERVVSLYEGSNSFAMANEIGRLLVVPIAARFSTPQIERMVVAACRNSQVRGSIAASSVLSALRATEKLSTILWDELLVANDTDHKFDSLMFILQTEAGAAVQADDPSLS